MNPAPKLKSAVCVHLITTAVITTTAEGQRATLNVHRAAVVEAAVVEGAGEARGARAGRSSQCTGIVEHSRHRAVRLSIEGCANQVVEHTVCGGGDRATSPGRNSRVVHGPLQILEATALDLHATAGDQRARPLKTTSGPGEQAIDRHITGARQHCRRGTAQFQIGSDTAVAGHIQRSSGDKQVPFTRHTPTFSQDERPTIESQRRVRINLKASVAATSIQAQRATFRLDRPGIVDRRKEDRETGTA